MRSLTEKIEIPRSIKQYQTKLKNTMIEIKSAVESIHIRLGQAEERLWEEEDKSREII